MTCLLCIKKSHINQRLQKCNLSAEKIELFNKEEDLWHRRMGHISANYLNHLKHAAEGITEFKSSVTITTCQCCAKAKLTRKLFKKDRERATRVGEILHANLIGKITPPTFIDRNNYIACIITDYSSFLHIFTLKQKSETAIVLNETDHNIQAQYLLPG